MKPGDIILYINTHPSFSWNNGLYIIISLTNTEVNMCKLNKLGKPTLFDDGRYMVSTTSYINNSFITTTKLSYDLESNPKHN